MEMYMEMGDEISWQYVGSAAHNKVSMEYSLSLSLSLHLYLASI